MQGRYRPGGRCVENRCVGAGAIAGEAGASGTGEAGAPSTGEAGASSGAPPAGYGKSCNLPSDCPSPLKCGNNGQCIYQCNAGSDCDAVGACCVAHQCATGSACEAGSSGGASGTGGSGGAGGTGGGKCQPCVSNSACDDGLYCNGQEQCYAGCCAPALDTPCDSHSACIVDSCDEKTKKCSSKVIAAEDVDGDGHLAFGCADGDDCNDSDPTVYTGHVETYDGKDNDCNGYIDDWTAESKGPTSGALATGGSDGLFGVPINGGPGTWLVAAINQTWNVAPLDKKWGIGANVGSPIPLTIAAYSPIDAASGPDSACFLDMANDQVQTMLVDATGAMIKEVALGGTYDGYGQYAAVTWTGSQYLIGWNAGISPDVGAYALLDSAGNLNGEHSLPGASLLGTSPVSVAGNGTSLAVAYQLNDTLNSVEIAVLNVAGALGGTLDMPTTAPGTCHLDAVGAAPDAYVVLWDQAGLMYATYVPALNAKPGTPQTFSAGSGAPLFARAASDGVGTAFLIQYNGSLAFGYLNANLKNPFELSGFALGGTLADMAGGIGGRLGVFYTQGGSLYGRQAGYAGLTGDACSLNSNCASGKCQAVVASGPKAYSTCQ